MDVGSCLGTGVCIIPVLLQGESEEQCKQKGIFLLQMGVYLPRYLVSALRPPPWGHPGVDNRHSSVVYRGVLFFSVFLSIYLPI